MDSQCIKLWVVFCRCGHCKNLAPHWASAATELKGKVKLGAVDATAETVMAGRFGVSLSFHIVARLQVLHYCVDPRLSHNQIFPVWSERF